MRKITINYLIVAVVIVTVNSIYSCNFSGSLKGSGNVITQARHINYFTSLEIEDAYTVELIQGDSSSITIIADSNFLPYIKTELDGGELKVYNDKSLLDFKSLKLLITFKQLDEITTKGAVDITGDSLLRFEKLKMSFAGASKVSMHLQADELSVNSVGANEIMFSGNCNKQTIKIAGAGSYDAYGLVSNEADANLAGAAVAHLNVTQKLTADCIGASVIKYKGEPAIKEFKSVGASSIEQAGK